MSFMNISEPPPKNPEYIVPFNILLEECWKRGIGPEIKPKQNGESVQQSDLDNIRRAILTEYDFFFVPDQLKLEKADPFTEAEAHPKFNDGKGFLLMPDIYTSTGRAIFKFRRPATDGGVRSASFPAFTRSGNHSEEPPGSAGSIIV